jgi:hypothetical protein
MRRIGKTIQEDTLSPYTQLPWIVQLKCPPVVEVMEVEELLVKDLSPSDIPV